MSLAILTLEGFLGRDPEVKFGQNGEEFCHFPVAVNNSKTKQTNWYNVTCNGKLVSVAVDYLKKGDPVLIIGKLTPRDFTSNGVKGVSLDVFANVIDLIARKSNNDNEEDPTSFNPAELEGSPLNGSSSKPPTTNKVAAAPKPK